MEIKKNAKDALLLLSGGPDSTATIFWAITKGYKPQLITIQLRDHAQDGEIVAAMEIARVFDLVHTIIDLKSLVYSGLNPEIAILMHAQARDDEILKSNGRLIPFGSGMVLSIISSIALYRGIDTVIWGATKDDGVTNPQYSQEFSSELSSLITRYTTRNLEIIAPLASFHKYEIIKQYYSQDKELFAKTWSCSKNNRVQCGECHPCLARRYSAMLAKHDDLTFYVNKDATLSEEIQSNCNDHP